MKHKIFPLEEMSESDWEDESTQICIIDGAPNTKNIKLVILND